MSGRVVAADGKTPVANATILLDQWPLATTGEDGSFAIAHAPAKWSLLTARKDALIAQRTSDSIGKSSATLKLEKASVVSGRVTRLENEDAGRRRNREPRQLATVLSAGGGRTHRHHRREEATYSIIVPAGAYSLFASHPAFALGNAEVTVTAGQQASKDISLTQYARVSGVVVDEEQKPVVAAAVASEEAAAATR